MLDRGYCDSNWLAKLTANDVRFVTRLETSATFVAVESRPVAPGSAVRSDEGIVFTQHATDANDWVFRRIVYWDEQQQREFEFLVNHVTLDAALVAAAHKQCWQIELLFRALKQNLKIKTFVGTSAIALKIHIWTALIALLIVRYLQLRSRLPWHVSRFVALLLHQLFVYNDLWRFRYAVRRPAATALRLPGAATLPFHS